MPCEEHVQRMEQIESKLAAKDEVAAKIIERLADLEKKVAFQERALESLKATLEEGTRNALTYLHESFDALSNRLEANIQEQWNAIQGLETRMDALKELESWEQSGIDDGNSVELQRAPAEGE